MRFKQHLSEASGVKISPLLKSMIGKPKYSTSQPEVEGIMKSLGKVRISSDTKGSLAMSTTGRTKDQYYISLINKSKEYDTLEKDITKELKRDGWKVTKSEDKGNEGYWIYFTK